jgi:hypothetical protein
MKIKKFQFSAAQRYSVWLHHEKRCWFCKEPLGFVEVTVDHVIPESLLSEPLRLKEIIDDYDLPSSFQINGYENWLPAHSHCNGTKTNKVFSMTPSYRPIFEQLIQRAAKVKRTAEAIQRDQSKAKVLTSLLTALERNKVSLTDLADLISAYASLDIAIPGIQSTPKAFLRLDNGYFIDRASISFEGPCECEREACVGKTEKVYCYWPNHLSSWVKGKHLFHRCFDETIKCPRCDAEHRRGDVGRAGTCGNPYTDQDHQVDLHGAHESDGEI